MNLRWYQDRVVKKTLEYFSDKKNTGQGGMIIMPCGTGKSLVAASITKNFGKNAVILQPSVELLYQNSEKYGILGGEYSIYSAKAKSKELSDVTFATIGSVKNLGKEFRKQGIDTIIADEIQNFPPTKGSMFRKFVDDLKPKHIVGLTATPCRLYSMGNMEDNYSVLNFLTNRIKYDFPYFKNIIDIVQIEDIKNDFWSPVEYELYDFDEGSLRYNSTGSEYTEESIKRAVKEQGINNLIYKRVKELNSKGINRNLIFCDSIETAEKMSKIVPNSAFICGQTEVGERERIIRNFKSGEIYNVFNYGILGTGFDYPELQTVIIGRPTNSYIFFYQALGRVVRPHENKEKSLIIDYCNNVKRFGRLEDLNIEYIDDFGWGMFNENKLLTNIRMGTSTITKDMLKGNIVKSADDDDIKFWFGKHNGKKPSECPLSYLKWFVDEAKINHLTTEETKRLIFQSRRVLEKEKSTLF